MSKKLLLIDGNSLAFRAFYAMYKQLDRMISHKGLHTNALVAFNNFFDQIVDPLQPDLALVAWDAGKGSSTFRGKAFSEYKADRQSTPEELKEQFPYLRQLVEGHGVKAYEQAGYEADDIIGTLARQGEAAGYEVIIYTGDRDLTQLVTDKTTVNVSKRGVTDLDVYTPAFLAEKYDGLKPSQIIEMKGLTGDTSDHYPGVTKVGEKTAIKLLNEFGSIDGIYEHVDDMKPSKLKEHLIEDKDVAYQARSLATIKTDVDLEISLDDIAYTGINFDELLPFYEDLDFKQQLAKIKALRTSGAMSDSGKMDGEINGNSDASQANDLAFTLLTQANLNELPHFTEPIVFYIELDNPNYHTANPVGFVVGNAQQGFYASRDMNLLTQSAFQTLLNSDVEKQTFNVKALLVIFHRLGLTIEHVDTDILLMTYLLDTTDNDNQLATLANRYDVYLADDESVYGKGAKFSIPDEAEILEQHLVHKADAIRRLAELLPPLLEQHHQTALYDEIELPLARVLAQMEIRGITLDTEQLRAIGVDLSQRIDHLKQQIYAAAGETFNINSPKQLGELLFEKMGIPPIKKTKTGYSTAVDVLEQLAPQVPMVGDILNYRQLTKLRSTYVEGLLSDVHEADSKIHTRYLQTLTQTGRLSSVDPNMQNIPVRDEEGRRLRKAFVASQPDWSIFSSDYSQIELRVLAHMTGEKGLQAAFQNDEDIHAATARSIFGLKPTDEVDYEMRRKAKAVNFGIVYGISDFGLATRLGISRSEGKEIIDTYYREFPGVKDWIETIVAQAHRDGYVETIAHRRRYLPDIHSRNFNLRSFAERTAMNAPIQGSAADIIKIAMVNMEQAIQAAGLQSRMLLQVHDELIFEGPDQELPELEKLVPKVMDSAMQLDVPLKVESHTGKTWYDAK